MMHLLETLKPREVFPGFHGRFIHTEKMTLAFWKIDKHAAVPEHNHVHEQVVNVLTGEFELTIEGVQQTLKPGMVAVVPSNARHSGKATTECTILDIFSPVRGDYIFV